MTEKHFPVEDFGSVMKSLEEASGGGIKVPTGKPFAVRVDGVGFSKFTRAFEKPFDPQIMDAMLFAAEKIINDFQPVLTYVQSDEVTFLFSGDVEPPMAGRVVKIASRLAAQMTSAFVYKISKGRPSLGSNGNPHFDGRVTWFEGKQAAVWNIQWRDMDARKNAVSAAAATVYSERELSGKNRGQRLVMLREAGIDFSDYPEEFRTGVYLRRVKELREMTEQELRDIPQQFHPDGPVERSVIKRFHLPGLSGIQNLTDVIFDGADPVFVGEVTSDS